jgi:ubiquinone biosynthesis protein
MINDQGDLVLMDFGLVGTLSARDKDDILDFLKLMMQNDAHGFVRKLQTVAVSMHVEDISELETSLGYIFEELNSNVNDFNIAEVAMNFQTVISKSQIILPENYYLLLRTLSMLEGMVRVIDPTYNFVGEIQPILMKYIMQNYSPKNLLKKAFGSLKDLDYALTIGPKKVLSIIDKLEDGQIKVQFEVNHLKESVASGERVMNRLSMTLFIVGLMLCSTILLAFKIPPVIWEETSLLGLVGFTTSFVLILYTLYMIYRKRI